MAIKTAARISKAPSNAEKRFTPKIG